ncbi:MAG: DUF4450 domain-containing protein [Mariniphaga sp.]
MLLTFKRQIIFLVAIMLSISGFSQPAITYTAENGAIVGRNTGRYNNRPLYINNTNAFVLTGDQPIMRLAKDQYLFGTFMLAVERNGKTRWLQQCSQIISIYTAGKMSWEVTDKDFPGLKIKLEVVPMASNTGMAIRASAEGWQAGDQLIWTFGGAQWRKGQNLSWKLDVMGQPELLTLGFEPNECKNNSIENSGQVVSVSLLDSAKTKKLFTVTGNCTSKSVTNIGDASVWSEIEKLKRSKSDQLPLLQGIVTVEKDKPVYWVFEATNKEIAPDLSKVNYPEKAFADGLKRTESFQNRLKINTPDPYLNAIAPASVAAVDGTWYPPVFVHGALQWNNRFPGWRTIFGGTMYGWHDRVRDEAKFYTGSQVKTSDKKEAKADPATLLTEQHADSRFYGVGHITKDQNFYDMQTQFFDQIIEEYRWTADPELLKFFREALELHLIWIRDCFDPDSDGTYESYINVWPTDSQWYNGGGSAEETSYAYRGHLAASDMARNEGDVESESYHNQMLDKIKKGFFDKLWIKSKGHSGSYREQGGHERLHEDPWLYSIFLPVDAGLTSPLQSIESVYYSEWALQNDKVPGGGRQVWTSNWVPAIWSIRELWPGDNYHLALSYFQSGLPNDGYDILKGTFMRTAYNHISPGNLGGIQGGVDFGDCIHTFSRALVSGLFGYRPDYPNNKVIISPQFPTDWNNASIELPDVKIAFNRIGDKINYNFELARTANLEMLLPVQCEGIKQVTVNGKQVKWELLPGVGGSTLNIKQSGLTKAELAIETIKSLPYFQPETVEGTIGKTIQIKVKGAKITGVEDPQQVIDNEKITEGVLSANLVGNKGYHTVVLKVISGNAPQWRVFRIKISDPQGDAKNEARFVAEIPANVVWENVDIASQLNADIRTIYQQKYLSPRPNTVSVRLGTDGYSPWTFPHWKSLPPEIKLNQVKGLLNDQNRLVTPQKVPFIWNGETKNVAFTSMWDNYPKKIQFPVNKTGDAIYFLVSGSTNVMQCQIANAVIRLNYADGKTDSLELVPPVNYWNVSTIDSHATAPGQGSRIDYTSEIDRFCMPAKFPETVRLGDDCRAMLLNLKMRKGVELKSISLETLSQEVVVGLMGISVMKLK